MRGCGWMAKGPESAAGRLSTLVAEIEATAYARGKADARKEVLAALGAGEKTASRPRRSEPPGKRPAGQARANKGKRAPRGAVRPLVERALRDRPGSTPPEILERAANDGERLVKPASVQVELYAGRREGRYESRDGRWSLAASPAADDGAPDAPVPGPDAAAGAATGGEPGGKAEAPEPETGGSQVRLGMNW